jgi:hypothetical protein
MVRILNIACVVLIGMAVLGLYYVSEKTRVTQVDLARTQHQIAQQRRALSVLETEWQHVAAPARVQHFAGLQGMNDAASVQLSAFDQLPQRGENAPLNGSAVRNASAEAPATQATPPGF